MIIVTSISPVEKVYTTMSQPVRVMCNDFKHYICKFGKPHDLFNEYIAASFCRCWDIPVPYFVFVMLNSNHLPPGFPKANYKGVGFGSEHRQYASEVSKMLLTWKGNQYAVNKIINKDAFLKIGLFDLWLCNEDRNHNNANLLLEPRDDGYYFLAIDHVNIFNTGNLDKGLTSITEDESILYSEYTTLLYRNSEKTLKAILDLENLFRKYIAECQQQLTAILEEVPLSWNIDLQNKREQLEQLFDVSWLQQTKQNFRLYIGLNFT